MKSFNLSGNRSGRPAAALIALCLVTAAFGQSFQQSFDRARELLKQRQFSEALEESQRAMHLDPSRWEGWFAAGTAAVGLAKYDLATDYFEEALPRAPESAKPTVNDAIASCRRAAAQAAPVSASSPLEGAWTGTHSTTGNVGNIAVTLTSSAAVDISPAPDGKYLVRWHETQVITGNSSITRVWDAVFRVSRNGEYISGPAQSATLADGANTPVLSGFLQAGPLNAVRLECTATFETSINNTRGTDIHRIALVRGQQFQAFPAAPAATSSAAPPAPQAPPASEPSAALFAFTLSGPNCYGLLKVESGIVSFKLHRDNPKCRKYEFSVPRAQISEYDYNTLIGTALPTAFHLKVPSLGTVNFCQADANDVATFFAALGTQ